MCVATVEAAGLVGANVNAGGSYASHADSRSAAVTMSHARLRHAAIGSLRCETAVQVITIVLRRETYGDRLARGAERAPNGPVDHQRHCRGIADAQDD